MSQDSDVLKKIIIQLNETPDLFDIRKAWVVLTEDSGDNQYENIKKFIEIMKNHNIKVDSCAPNHIIISTFEDLSGIYQIVISKKSLYFKIKSNHGFNEIVKIFEKMIEYKKTNPDP